MNDSESLTENALNEDEDQLVAYLDGELDETQVAHLESRLASDELLRRRMQELQKTWDLLDVIPPAKTAESFTKTTIELVTKDAARRSTPRLQRWARWFARGLVYAAILAISLWSGFQVIRYSQTAPLRSLIRDFRVINNVDLYLSVENANETVAENLQFIQQLDRSGLFTVEDLHDD